MVVLVMIVRNEEKTIADTLRSALPAVDRVCIVDTGSTDDTINMVRETLAEFDPDDLQGLLSVRPWVDYSTNRNEALELAIKEFGPDNWFWMLDADTRIESAENLRRWFQADLVLDSASLLARFKDSAITWPMHTILRGTSPCRYTGVVHEVLRKPEGSKLPEPAPIPGVEIVYQGTDAKDKTDTWHAHIDLLRAEIDRKGGWVNAPRETYYLAQTYACLEEWDQACEVYNHRWHTYSGYDAERWYAGLQACWCAQMSDKPGRDCAAMLLELCGARPWRAEAWYRLALEYGDRGDWQACYDIAWKAAQLPIPDPSKDAYMIQRDVYQWEARVLVAIAATELDPMKGYRLLTNMLREQLPDLPAAELLRLQQLKARCMAGIGNGGWLP